MTTKLINFLGASCCLCLLVFNTIGVAALSGIIFTGLIIMEIREGIK